MKKLILVSFLLLMAAISMNAQNTAFPRLTGPYFGQKPPASEPVLFAPGTVSNGIDHCSAAFSPDGKEMYWELVANGIAKIGFSKVVNGVWSEPELVSFCKGDTCIYGNPFISVDGNKMFLTSFRPGAVSEDKENIWYSERTAEGWSEPKPVNPKVNALRIHWSISVSNSGTLYFQGTKLDKSEEGGIYFSKLVHGEYTEPIRMGPEINTQCNETCPYIAPDESYILFNKFDMKEPQNSGIFVSYRNKSGKWIPAKRILGGSPDKGGMSPRISPDGKYIFYANRGIFWMPIQKRIEELRPKE